MSPSARHSPTTQLLYLQLATDEISYHLRKKFSKCTIIILADASTHPSQKYVQAVASSNDGSWLKLWDLALERGVFGTTCIEVTLRFLSLHAHSDGTCPAPNCSFYIGSESPCGHFLSAHTSLDTSLDYFIRACTNFSVSLSSYGHGLHSCFKFLWNHSFVFQFISLPSLLRRKKTSEKTNISAYLIRSLCVHLEAQEATTKGVYRHSHAIYYCSQTPRELLAWIPPILLAQPINLAVPLMRSVYTVLFYLV